MGNNILYIVRYLVILLLISCNQESEFFIDKDLIKYYASFKSEANKRGIRIEDDNLIMLIQDNVISNYGGNGVTRITKDQTYIYIDNEWFNKRGDLIERTIFHELGHAKLKRDHTNGWSLMNPIISQCYGDDCDSSYDKALYNELFNKWL